MRDFGLVVSREVLQALRLRTFWIILVVFAAGSTAAMVVPELLDDDRTRIEVGVVGTSDVFELTLRAVATPIEVDVDIVPMADLDAARRAVDDEDVDVAAAFGSDAVVIARSGLDALPVGLVRQALGVTVLAERLEGAGLERGEITGILSSPPPRFEEVDAGGEDRRAAAAIVATVLYVLLLLLVVGVATGVAIEKSNRISEVLLAVVRPGALLFGKVIGVAVTGLLTLAAGLVPVVVKQVAGGELPDGLASALLGGAPWIFVGLALYLTAAAALGALVERQEEAGSAVTPLSALLIAALILAQNSPDTPLGQVLAYVPFTAPLMVPARLALGVASSAEVAISLGVGVAAAVLMARFAAVVYRRGIVHTGKRLSLTEVLRRPTTA